MSLRGFAIAWAGGLVAVLALLAAGEVLFERMLQFGAPIALVVFATTGVIVGALDRRPRTLSRRAFVGAVAAAVLVAAALGIGLATEGDAQSGRLSLPALASTTPLAATGGASTPGAASTLPARFNTPADVKGVTFVIVEGSRATFTVNEKLSQLPLPSDAVMSGTALTGEIHLDGRPSTVALNLLQLSSDQSRRDGFVRRELFSRNPTATLTVTSLPALPERYEAGQVVKRQVSGTLAINGTQRTVSFETASRLDGSTLNVLGRTSFVWSDFDYRAPSIPGTVTVQDRVAVEVLIVARAQAG